MNSCDVVGYANTEDGYCICLDCVTDEQKEAFHPIFADSEWDAYPSCDGCLGAIDDVCLTPDGLWLEVHEQMKLKNRT